MLLRVADIKADDHLELINKDHVIAHVSTKMANLILNFLLNQDVDIKQLNGQLVKHCKKMIVFILMLCFLLFAKYTFDVEKTRVGEDIDYDKLTLRIHTDGSENPVDVLHYAVSVLRTQLEHFLVSYRNSI